MAKSRPVVKSKINEWYDWLVDHVPKSMKEPVSSAYFGMKNRILSLYGDVKERLGLKDQVEEQAEKEHGDEDQQSAEPVEHEHAMNSAYKKFRIGGQKKTGVHSYIALVKPRVVGFVRENVVVLNAAKVQLHLWIVWKKREERLTALDHDDMGRAEEEKWKWQDYDGAYYTRCGIRHLRKIFIEKLREKKRAGLTRAVIYGNVADCYPLERTKR